MNLTPTARRRLSLASLVVLVASLVVVATRAQGHDVPEPELHDGGIWVTNQDLRLIGRTNAQIATVDTKLAAGADAFDVLQSGDVVLVHQTDPSALAAIDPATAAIVPGPELPDGAQIGLGADVAALLDEGGGGIFIRRVTSSTAALALDPAGDIEPVHTASGPARLVVGVDGLVHLYEVDSGRITTWDGDGAEIGRVTVESGLEDAQLSAVGALPVLLDGERLIVAGHDPVTVDVGGGTVVQEPGPDHDAVLVAGDASLVAVPLDGGEIVEVATIGTGDPARPVRVGGCSFGGWGGDPMWVQACDGSDAATGPIAELDAGVEVRFRVNRGRVTLNSITEGSQLLFGDGDPIFIDSDWAEALSDEIEIDPEASEEIDEESDPTCESPENGDPVAEPDDMFGTRRDRPVVVHPLRNDSDPDCDVLLVDAVDLDDENAGTVGIIDGGRAVQVEVAPDVDELTFTYAVTDGRGGRDTAPVTVRVVPEDQNAQPVLGREATTVVTGGTITHNVLATAYDPDGDVLRLERAEEQGTATGTVKANSRGDVTFTAGNSPGTVEIAYTVGDGRGGEQTGILDVTVVDRRENHPPDARNDAETTFTGREVTVDVLANDTDPNGDSLSIVRATTDSTADVRWDPTSSEIRVASDEPGTVNVMYRVTDGQETSEAVLRVDVRDRGEKRPPVAVRDEVLLTAGEPAYVPVLDNDVDPDGEVLVVLGVTGLPEPSPIAVRVLQRSVLHITADTALTEPVELTYRISDGTDVADGRVLVEPAPTTEENRPPVLAADEYRVRAGGIVTFPVLSNDSDPDGDPLSIVAPPEDQADVARDGRLFLSEDGLLRYEAPDRPRGSIRLIYSARDTASNVASAELVVHVLPADADRNQPPVAPGLIGRTVAGQRVAIPVPVTTMDPDGDAVTLLGLDEPPSFGTIVEVRPDALVYLPDENAAGTDEFRYRVVDQHGAEATATVLVGVAGRPRENNPPIPVDDEATVRPGSTVHVPVLANDFDPDADPLTIVTDDDLAPNPSVGRATVAEDGTIRYTAPADPEVEQTSFRYTVDDGRGARRSATVTLDFRRDGDNRPPVAVDDATEPQIPETELALSLLDNDRDPDQDPLRIVEVSMPEARISADGQRVTLTVPTEPVQFTYLVSDGTDTARAAVSVPVVDPDADLPPIARLDEDIEVDLGRSVTVDVLDNDEDPEGADLHLLRVIGVRHGSARIDGNQVTFTASEGGYVGDAGFSYVVGDDADPAVANTSIASARVRIIGDLNTAPAVVDLTVDVPQGGDSSIDLRRAVDDPDPADEHTFQISAVDGSGVTVELDGTNLAIAAGTEVPAGTTASVDVTVSDGTDEATGTVTVRVTGSDEPLATVGADVGETFQGQPVTIDVLANDTNPFPETPLRILSVGEPTSGAGDTGIQGGSVTFTPADEFHGTTSFEYRIADATGDPAREVAGTVSVTVIGRPSAPPAPTCIGGESRSVRVQWSAPSANGAEISGYVLRVSGNGSGTGERTIANASTQDVDGLTNGADYTFQVGAVNAAVTETGSEPEFSPPSPACTPDQVPGQPAAPVTTFGDGELDVTWQLPENEGSPIERLVLTNTTSGESIDLGPTITEHTWTGLENGTSVRFTLTAENALGRGPTSDPSTGDGIPAGPPLAPPAPDAAPSVGARDGFLDVRWTWSSSLENGDPIRRFRVTPYRAGTRGEPVVIEDPSDRTTTFETDNGVEYRFTVEAENKAGWSDASPQSAAAVSAGRPLGAPTVSASEGDTQSVLTVGGSVDDNGAAIIRHEYDVNGNGTWRVLPENRRITGLSNGATYRFRVRAVNSEGAGPASAPSAAVSPYGSPSAPSVSRTVNDRTISWTWTASNGNGRDIAHYEYRLDGGSWQQTSSRSFSRTFGYEETHTLRVRAVSTAEDAARRTSGTGSASGTTDDAPQPSVESFRTGTAECDSHPGSTCTVYNVRGSNLAPNASVTVYCQWSLNGGPWSTNDASSSAQTNGNGAFTGNSTCHVGTNTRMRHQVRVGGSTYYSDPVTM